MADEARIIRWLKKAMNRRVACVKLANIVAVLLYVQAVV